MCEASEVSPLVECLRSVESLTVDEVDRQSCLERVSKLLDELQRCSDSVAGAARMVTSTETGTRSRGLAVLQGLGRVVLVEAVESEVSVAEVLSGLMSNDQERSAEEQCAISMALFALAFFVGMNICCSRCGAGRWDGEAGRR